VVDLTACRFDLAFCQNVSVRGVIVCAMVMELEA
jgi:hypothetical protein